MLVEELKCKENAREGVLFEPRKKSAAPFFTLFTRTVRRGG